MKRLAVAPEDLRISIRRLAADGSAEDRELRQVAREDQTVSLADLDAYLRTGVPFAKSGLARSLRPTLETIARADAAETRALLEEAELITEEVRALSSLATQDPAHTELAAERLATRAAIMSALAKRGLAPHQVQSYAHQLGAQEATPPASGENERAAQIHAEATSHKFTFENSAGQTLSTARALIIALLNGDAVRVDGHTLRSLSDLSTWHRNDMATELERRALMTPEKKEHCLRLLGAAKCEITRAGQRLSFEQVIQALSRGEPVVAGGTRTPRTLSSLTELEIWTEEARNPFAIQVKLERTLPPERIANAHKKLAEWVAAGWTLRPETSAECLRALFMGDTIRIDRVRVDRTWWPGGERRSSAWSYYVEARWEEDRTVTDSVTLTSLEALEGLAVRAPR